VRLDRRLTRLRGLVPEMVGEHAASLTVADVRRTATGMAVFSLADDTGTTRLVVKIPTTTEAAAGLERETEVLTSLRGDPRLGEWRDLLPRPVARGEAQGRPYRADAALSGAPPDGRLRSEERRRLIAAAAETIGVLHHRTATSVRGDDALAERWIDVPVRELWPGGPNGRGLSVREARLRDELRATLLAHTFRTSWVHGDLWPGNLLVDRSAEHIHGIVDWDAAATPELPLHDILHLALYARPGPAGRELGAFVAGHLRGAPWHDDQRALIERGGGLTGGGAISQRHALLLYWLRRAAAHASQQGVRRGLRYRVWERRNVDPVMEAL
jgi:aminoglycoside phosphotransferase (APT) family kinase protein